ncbi:hypothetical protein DBV05_g11421 [Lasiodiplodia theobromae]|uniref:Uncharacterized protein n=1 Tax=Lasiodiplodia theobromae TaxID=45133 RepID=A0A5N5CX23_9PEZI|nr:hypothetical protein DBV05_g11421 [Lasiodiplodia theobromae]
MIAEGLFGIWLGAFKEGCHEELFKLCPFPIDSLGRRGTCSHSPLTEPLHTPIDAEKAKAHSKEYFSEYYKKMKSTMTAEETEEFKRKRREATQNRQKEREHAANYNAKDEVKERKKKWWAENPDKREQYNEKSRAKRAKR